jgi:hypothetical protein
MSYQRPQVDDFGSVQDLTAVIFKDFTGADGVVLQPAPGVNIPLGNVS